MKLKRQSVWRIRVSNQVLPVSKVDAQTFVLKPRLIPWAEWRSATLKLVQVEKKPRVRNDTWRMKYLQSVLCVFSRKEIGGGRPWRAFPFVRYLNMFRPERFRSLANFELENGYGFCLQSAYMTMILKGISRTSQQVCLLKSKCIRKRSTKNESFKLMFRDNLTNF